MARTHIGSRLVLALLVFSGIGFASYLADELIEGDSFRYDTAMLLALRRPGELDMPIGPHWLLQSAIDLSALGGFTVMWLLGIAATAFLLLVRRRREALWFAVSLVGASSLSSVIKLLVHRSRPELVPHLAMVSNASFPSGHATISTAVYLTLALMIGRTQRAPAVRGFLVGFAILIAVLIGCSRVFLGVHWPSDVLAGWCCGAAWALAVLLAHDAMAPRPQAV